MQILIPIDGTDASKRALDFAIDMAVGMDGASTSSTSQTNRLTRLTPSSTMPANASPRQTSRTNQN
ncbi:universal stress protein [Haloferax profundi]|uniref:universal stress protein n=1 Tax=Haloferax profundi TaxID=1544718 RepID=UPI000AE977EF|nr:universal stress protein [Haloferax profundi]